MQNKIAKCIFHIPNYIDLNRKSASNIRPFKMIKAFQDIGYQVDCVMGYGKERKKSIKEIKKNIKNGVKYDFLYSESSTMPTLLTEKNHLPTHPFLDFSFFRFCKKHNIKIGLFYRDIHWRFDLYRKNVSFFKRFFAKMFYKYDLFKYRELLNILYLASEQVKKYLPSKSKKCNKYKIKTLPPGCEIKETQENKSNKDNLELFYVGGMSEELYDFEKVLIAVNEIQDVNLTVCCREKEWQKLQPKYSKYINKNIHIIHITGKELEEFYKNIDVCIMLFKQNPYMQMAMPVKLFEYLENNKPIIATRGTVAGDFIEKNNIGISVEYDVEKIKNVIQNLRDNTQRIEEIKANQKRIIKDNTWTCRARTVVQDLK